MTADTDAARGIITRGVVLTLLGLLGIAVEMVLAIKFTPIEALQGPAQKIFYVHVPAAVMVLWVAVPLAAGVVRTLRRDIG